MASELFVKSPLLLEDDEGVDLQCGSWDGEATDGEFKTKNQTPDEVQRWWPTNRGSETYFEASCRIITCLHGFLNDKEPRRPATLLVLKYKLNPKPAHRFSSISTSFTFQDKSSPSASPRVIACAPFSDPQLYNEKTSTIKTTTGFGVDVGVTGGTPATASVNANTSNEETHLHSYFSKGTAAIVQNRKTFLDDTVVWTLEQNKIQNLGVYPTFRAAVLIERNNQDDFVGYFRMHIKGGFIYKMGQIGESVDRFLRRVSTDDPVNFSPAKRPRQGKIDGLPESRLGLLMREDGYLAANVTTEVIAGSDTAADTAADADSGGDSDDAESDDGETELDVYGGLEGEGDQELYLPPSYRVISILPH